MIISKTPFRISFLGGGTDYPAWFQENGGSVLGTTIDKYCYIMVRDLPPYFDDKFRVVYRLEEFVEYVDAIQHPKVRECLRYLRVDNGMEVIHWSDMPARKGMGTSSSFTVGLLNALCRGKITKPGLAEDAVYIEQKMCGESVGNQDQYHSTFGGFNRIDFGKEVKVTPVNGLCLEPYLILVDTGSYRIASRIASEQIREIGKHQSALSEMKAMVDKGIRMLNDCDVESFAHLVNDSWELKKTLSPSISNPKIDLYHSIAMKNGAMGGKLLGAGGEGYMLFLADPKIQPQILKVLGLKSISFKFETEGSTIIYADNN